ncbi:protein phosphatase 1 regulatory subunit 36 isoform X3 [Panthera pardus]|uniref:Protein phosphatase 1 regulatory subunit 36 isoform X3 n=1 Tax=Panthera pardus TaxID=9691 RepID=A0A9V1FQ63_PANPR|nr:protein phosphatase 1 regulatory subunit 36 isoform X3 [Panthera pardus]XP_042799423.1 protein phosphatase 1 regulatory subunit 36 isoform X3 [Panthera leo]
MHQVTVPELYSRRKRAEGQGASSPEQLGLRLGMWYWKDETRTLEFRSFTPAVELKEKGKKGKAIHFAEIDGPASDRLTDKKLASRDDKSLKALEKRGQQGNVTLHDAKFVALFLLQDNEMQRICSFTTFMRGLVEKKEMELVIRKLEAAQNYLAQKYCVLVLGLAMPDKHHMCCGKEKRSDTQKDWKFFESFYTFCTYVAWIVFRRQHFTEIEEEIGRLFRTNMFNIPRRKREEEESGGEKKHMTFVQFRRMMAKRPAIKKAINMRSPVMSTLLPSLREKAQNIFEKKYHQGVVKLPAPMQEHMESLDSVLMPNCLLQGSRASETSLLQDSACPTLSSYFGLRLWHSDRPADFYAKLTGECDTLFPDPFPLPQAPTKACLRLSTEQNVPSRKRTH